MDVKHEKTPTSFSYRLTWTTLKKRLAPEEIREVKRLLGTDVIRKNKELYNEAATLFDMLTQFKAQNDETIGKMKRSIEFLSKPTIEHESLQAEIALLIEKLDGTTLREDDARRSFSHRRFRDETEHFIAKTSRPITPSSTIVETLTERERVTFETISRLSECIKVALREETADLVRAIDALNAALESESDHLSAAREKASKSKRSSLKELRRKRSSLEREWIATRGIPSGSPRRRSSEDLHLNRRRLIGDVVASRSSSAPTMEAPGGRKRSSFRLRFVRRVSEGRYLS